MDSCELPPILVILHTCVIGWNYVQFKTSVCAVVWDGAGWAGGNVIPVTSTSTVTMGLDMYSVFDSNGKTTRD